MDEKPDSPLLENYEEIGWEYSIKGSSLNRRMHTFSNLVAQPIDRPCYNRGVAVLVQRNKSEREQLSQYVLLIPLEAKKPGAVAAQRFFVSPQSFKTAAL